MRVVAYVFIAALCGGAVTAEAEPRRVRVGVISILSGDLGVLGRNVVASAETYRKHLARHRLALVVEDGKLSSMDGLRAYQRLINVEHVDVIIGACSSNGTIAAKALIDSSQTPTITVVTGGHNIDVAGPYVFRIGNSDVLNGIQEAEAFIAAGRRSVALFAEETEYTQDITRAFVPRFRELGGRLVYEQNFLPGTLDFRAEISAIRRSGAAGIFVPTQTGTALGMFVKQWREQGGEASIPIHTTFVAAPNPDAHAVAGEAIIGTYYMKPRYNAESEAWKRFLEFYRQDYSKNPEIAFHSAGTVDALTMIEAYLDRHETFDREGFKQFLLSYVKDFAGLMGTYSFDAEGNGNIGFELSQIGREDLSGMR